MDPLFRIEFRRVSREGQDDAQGFRAYLRGTVVSAAAYRRGEKTAFEVEGHCRRRDYRKKRGIAYVETLAPRGAAEFALVSDWLWKEVERVEKRRDSLLAYELLVSLPRDIPLEQCLKHLRCWVLAECVAKGIVADLAVHTYGTALDPEVEEQAAIINEVRSSGIPIYPLDEGDLLRRMPPDHHHAYELPDGGLLVYQPHAHILLTTREIGPEGFGLKVKAWGQRAQLYRWRQSWADAYNNLLAEAGRSERVTDVGAWRQKAEAAKRSNRLRKTGPISETMLRTIDIRGGHWAALEGRPPKHKDDSAPMTKFRFNNLVRELHKDRAALEAERETFEREQEDLVEAIARFQDLTDQGLDFDFEDEQAVLVDGAAGLLSDTDAQMLARHRKVLVKVFAVQPGTPASVDQALNDAMALVDSLERDLGVTFFRTDKGSLGYEPEGVVPPETYKKFSGMHEAILGELDRRKLAKLLVKGRAKLAEQKEQVETAAQEKGKLQQTLDQERADRRRLESSAEALFESARAAKPLPDVDAEAPLLQKLRHVILGYRQKVRTETERAEKAERARVALEKTVDMLWKSVHHLVRGLGSIAGWAGRKRPELKDGLNQEYDAVIAGLPEEARSQIKLKTVPGLRRSYVPTTSQGASPRDPLRTGPSATISSQSWTLPKPETNTRPAKKADDERQPRGAMPPGARWRKDQPER